VFGKLGGSWVQSNATLAWVGTGLRNGVVIAVHSNSFRTIRGTLVACIADEIAFWCDEAA
jgi:hypothetical protein